MKTTEQIVKDKVTKLMEDGKMFTAYDVTTILRNEGYTVAHYKLTQTVKELHLEGVLATHDYTGEVIDVGAPVKPVLYFHQYADPSMYDKNWVSSTIPNSVGSATIVDGATTSAQVAGRTHRLSTSNKDAVTPTVDNTVVSLTSYASGRYKGRISVPPAFAKSIQLKAHDVVEVVAFKDYAKKCSGVLLRKANNPDKDSTQIQVHGDGRIRPSVELITGVLGSVNKVEISKFSTDSIAILAK